VEYDFVPLSLLVPSHRLAGRLARGRPRLRRPTCACGRLAVRMLLPSPSTAVQRFRSAQPSVLFSNFADSSQHAPARHAWFNSPTTDTTRWLYSRACCRVQRGAGDRGEARAVNSGGGSKAAARHYFGRFIQAAARCKSIQRPRQRRQQKRAHAASSSD